MSYVRRTRRRVYRRRRSQQSLAKKAYRLAKKAYKLPELKYNSLSYSPTSVLNVGSINELSTVGTGVTDNNRVGNMVKPTSVKYRCSLKLNASATDTLVRMIVFRWISEAPAAPTDILQTVNITSFKNQDNRYQSQILKDVTFRLSTAEKPEIFIKGSIRTKFPVMYPDGSSVSNKNAIYVLFTSDELVNTPTIAWESRMYFRDS